METQIRRRVPRRLIWVCTVCQLPFYGSPDYNGSIDSVVYLDSSLFLQVSFLWSIKISSKLYRLIIFAVNGTHRSLLERPTDLQPRRLGILGRLSAIFYPEDKLCDFLFASLHTNPYWKKCSGTSVPIRRINIVTVTYYSSNSSWWINKLQIFYTTGRIWRLVVSFQNNLIERRLIEDNATLLPLVNVSFEALVEDVEVYKKTWNPLSMCLNWRIINWRTISVCTQAPSRFPTSEQQCFCESDCRRMYVQSQTFIARITLRSVLACCGSPLFLEKDLLAVLYLRIL